MKSSGTLIWITYDLSGGIYKLSVTDNGDGMTGPDMVKYINHLSSSSGLQAHNANFGVGAKIAAATRNQAGLVYLSWREGQGSMIHLWKDPQSGDYGLQRLERPGGTFDHWASLESSVKPAAIKNHGTKVVLYGNVVDADTMAPPRGCAESFAMGDAVPEHAVLPVSGRRNSQGPRRGGRLIVRIKTAMSLGQFSANESTLTTMLNRQDNFH